MCDRRRSGTEAVFDIRSLQHRVDRDAAFDIGRPLVVSATGDGSEAPDWLKVALLSNRLGRAHKPSYRSVTLLDARR